MLITHCHSSQTSLQIDLSPEVPHFIYILVGRSNTSSALLKAKLVYRLQKWVFDWKIKGYLWYRAAYEEGTDPSKSP